MQDNYINNKKAEGSTETAIKVVTAVVLGALLLVGLLGLINNIVIPSAQNALESMFAYGDEYEAPDNNTPGEGGTSGEVTPGTGNNGDDTGDTGELTPDEDTEIYYYTSLATAADDISAGTLGANDDSDAENGNIMVFTSEGKTHAKILKDVSSTQAMTLKKDLVLDLNGKDVAFSECTYGIYANNANVTVNAPEGSQMALTTSSGTSAIFLAQGGTLSVNGGTYNATSVGPAAGVNIGGSAIVELNNIAGLNVVSDTGDAMGVYNPKQNSKLYINDSNLYTCINDVTKNSYAVYNKGFMNATNSKMIGDMDFYYDVDISVAVAMALFNTEVAVLNNCEAYGVGYGIENYGEGAEIYVNGGDYASIIHGGFYFSHGSTGKAYVRNAAIGNKYMGKFIRWQQEIEENPSQMFAKMYVGGSTDSWASNMKVHLDSITWTGPARSIALRGTASETNNSVYISTPVGSALGVRIDNTTHSLYLGEGYDESITINSTDETRVFYTDERYVIEDSKIPTSATIGGNTDGGYGDIID